MNKVVLLYNISYLCTMRKDNRIQELFQRFHKEIIDRRNKQDSPRSGLVQGGRQDAETFHKVHTRRNL